MQKLQFRRNLVDVFAVKFAHGTDKFLHRCKLAAFFVRFLHQIRHVFAHKNNIFDLRVF